MTGALTIRQAKAQEEGRVGVKQKLRGKKGNKGREGNKTGKAFGQ